MTPEQSRAARAWLGWSQAELAKRAGVGLSTVQDFERGQRTPIPNNIAAMRRAIETAGVLLLFTAAGEAAGLARQNLDQEAEMLGFDQRGDQAGILRPVPRHRFI
jgi:transcriptional regulator with XRE-family HTH domain